MTQLIAFLRAINVGGHNIKMDTLRTLFVEVGCTNVETFIASGNVIFESKTKNTKTLESKIAQHLHKSLGYEVATFIRTAAEVKAIAQYHPFTEAEPNFAVCFLSEPLSMEMVNTLLTYRNEMDDLSVDNREVYWLPRPNQLDSPVSKVGLEKIIKSKATIRGINTIRRLAAKYPTTKKEEHQ